MMPQGEGGKQCLQEYDRSRKNTIPDKVTWFGDFFLFTLITKSNAAAFHVSFLAAVVVDSLVVSCCFRREISERVDRLYGNEEF